MTYYNYAKVDNLKHVSKFDYIYDTEDTRVTHEQISAEKQNK